MDWKNLFVHPGLLVFQIYAFNELRFGNAIHAREQ